MALRFASQINRFICVNKISNCMACTNSTKCFHMACATPCLGKLSLFHQPLKLSQLLVAKFCDGYKKPEMDIDKMKEKSKDLQPASLPKYYTPLIAVESAKFPSEKVPRKVFMKSNTQNAVTMPFNLQRLADPFPKPVKTLPSFTVSDEEKAEMMQKEAKMEAQFRQQRQQEWDMKNNPKGNNSGKSYGLRHYSTMILDPECKSEVERCEMILNTLKAKYPDLDYPKRPFVIPGSPEEKAFVEKTLKFVAQHMPQLERPTAPFPSYSEVKTYVRKPTKSMFNRDEPNVDATSSLAFARRNYSTKPSSKGPRYLAVGRGFAKKCPGRKDGKAVDACGPKVDPRAKCKVKKVGPDCPSFTLQGCPSPHPMKNCDYTFDDTCKKQEAPYPSYSDLIDDQYEEEPSECKICPWGTQRDYSKYQKRDYCTQKRYYSTRSSMDLRRKAPCENPAGHMPPCDYENPPNKINKMGKNRCVIKKPPTCKSNSSKSNTPKKAMSESVGVVNKIRGWLNSWRPEQDNIKICKSSSEENGRETYIIEIIEREEAPCHSTSSAINLQHRCITPTSTQIDCDAVKPTNVVEMRGPSKKPDGKVRRMPNCNTVRDNRETCPKPQPEPVAPKPCRYPKKRPLPNCRDLIKTRITPPKRDESTSTNSSNISAKPKTVLDKKPIQPIETVGINKLKPQFWKMNKQTTLRKGL